MHHLTSSPSVRRCAATFCGAAWQELALKVRARGQEYDRFKARRALANARGAPGAAHAKAKPARALRPGSLDGQGHADMQVRMGSWLPLV